MKSYTSESQTAELIELGFEKPKGWCVEGISSRLIMYKHKEDNEGFNYSIGELLSLLPENIAKENETPSTLNVSVMHGEWCVQYADFLGTDFEFCNTVLIDALYDMILRLKEKGVI